MQRDPEHREVDPQKPRRRNNPQRNINRRVVMKATAGLAALSAAGFGAVPEPVDVAVAQEVGGTRAKRYVPAEEGTGGFSTAAAGDWQAFQADYEFFSIGASWDGGVGLWPVVEIQLERPAIGIISAVGWWGGRASGSECGRAESGTG